MATKSFRSPPPKRAARKRIAAPTSKKSARRKSWGKFTSWLRDKAPAAAAFAKIASKRARQIRQVAVVANVVAKYARRVPPLAPAAIKVELITTATIIAAGRIEILAGTAGDILATVAT